MATKLFVGNLPHSATEQILSEFVAGAGFHVASAIVIRDRMTGTPRGFGFVELAEGEDHQRAIADLNGQSLDGRPLTVNEARPQRADFGRPGDRGNGRESFGRPRNGGNGREDFARRRSY